MPEENRPTNYRETRRRNDRILLWLVVGTLLVVGTGLIGAIWGFPAAITGGLCLGGGAGLILLLWGLLSLMEKWVGDE